ncbi:Uncharacterised protein [BD1-7 clade bacterium]|uniref:Salt-induced outer membrane protein n=1 Tax=BD1-7 clade bacterium TaxID=2029982 RepID=A0A5S9Q6Z5_9GAMM|nr:Uncharacterised protein [BD1-7 clade bacterium]CAA0114459.1 Uncharacterised protein [BD1-7 clade bacterium]
MKNTVLAVGLMALSAASFAQEDGALDEAKGWSGNIELGYKATSGNTSENVLTYRQKIIYEATKWKNTIGLSADNNTSDAVKTQERYYVTEQLDYNFSAESYGFLRGTYDKDLFSGFAYQATSVAGYGHNIVDTDTIGFKIEVGMGGSYQEVEDTNESEQSLMGFFSDDFVWRFAETTELGQTLSLEYSEINTITRGQVYIKNTMLKNLSLKLSYGAKYTSEVPSGREHLDTEFLATVVFDY